VVVEVVVDLGGAGYAQRVDFGVLVAFVAFVVDFHVGIHAGRIAVGCGFLARYYEAQLLGGAGRHVEKEGYFVACTVAVEVVGLRGNFLLTVVYGGRGNGEVAFQVVGLYNDGIVGLALLPRVFDLYVECFFLCGQLGTEAQGSQAQAELTEFFHG